MAREPKNATIGARLTEAEKRTFFSKASAYGNPTEVLRELVIAFNQGRLQISPPTTPTSKEKLYVPRIVD